MDWPDRWHAWRSHISPQALKGGLDLVMVLVVVATYAQLGDPDLLFHIVWLFLALHAFAFGLRSTLIRLGLATAALTTYALLYAGGSMAAPLELVEWPLMFLIAGVVAVMADYVQTASQRYARLYRMAQDRLLTAQEAERNRLALDLHDGVGQTLSALALTLEVASGGPPGNPASVWALRRGRELAASAADDTRQVAQRLRPRRLEEIGLAAAIRDLAATAGMAVRIHVDQTYTGSTITPEIAVGVYRIVQEALANTARHSNANLVAITIAQPNDLVVIVQDNGVGFDRSEVRERGLGLSGMRERAGVLGGRVEMRSAPGFGTTVRIHMPVDGRARPATAETGAAAPDLAHLES
jgi:signal transduction histidine kinase